MTKFMSEMDVTTHFRKVLEEATGENFVSLKSKKGEGRAWETDGVLQWDSPNKTSVKLLLETKFGTDLTKSKVRSNVLAQTLYYCKKFSDRGDLIPNVIFIGDENHCFALSFDSVKTFLEAQIDWNRAPSNPDPNLRVDLDVHLESTLEVDAVKLKELCEQLAEGCVQKVRPCKNNLSAMYQYWVDHILPKNTYTPVEMVDVFYSCIFYSNEDENFAYEHPTKKNTIVVSGKEYKLNLQAMRGFFERRERGLSAKEIDDLVSMRDRIIEDDTRRRQGAFYTPTLWVDEAHKEMTSVLGSNWRDECIVWDCCAGTGNLTRDYDFKNLILSTAEAPDVEAIKRERYNEGAEVFQYDFLNPDAESPFFETGSNTLPTSVKKMLKEGAESGKRLVFLINPPYAEDGVAGAKGKARKGVAATKVSREMPKLGRANRQLYTQFMYQCEQVALSYGFKQKSVGLFSPILFMVSGSFSKFRSFWYERYSSQKGFLFQASNFADVSGSWGISFSIWNEGDTKTHESFSLYLKVLENENISHPGKKSIYGTDDLTSASTWVSEKSPKSSSIDTPKFSSGLKVKEVKGNDKGSAPNGLGVVCNKANNVAESATGVCILSGKPTDKGRCNFDLTEGEGWRRAIALYSARKLSEDTWITHNDEYLAPLTEKEGYEQWVDDCHVFTLLESKNNMTSMRNVEYKGKKWNIHNHFFWLTRAQAMDIYSNHSSARNLYRDAKSNPIPFTETNSMVEETPEWRKNGDPYFSYVLPSLNLSPLAEEILSDLNTLFIESLQERAKADEDLHLNTWDAGIYQHNKMWKNSTSLNLKWDALKTKHKQLAQQLKHGVYTYGFLK
jgi:hypothetical protein